MLTLSSLSPFTIGSGLEAEEELAGHSTGVMEARLDSPTTATAQWTTWGAGRTVLMLAGLGKVGNVPGTPGSPRTVTSGWPLSVRREKESRNQIE